MWQAAAFLVGSLGLVYLSRASLAHPGTHGFYRFFAWEATLALLVLHLPHWFAEAGSWHQLISWVLLLLSLLPLILGIRGLRRQGHAGGSPRADPSLYQFERTTQLVTTGIYRLIRHPMYCSLLLLAWGVFFKQPAWPALGLAAAATAALVLTARCDEAECIATFGDPYRQYMRHTRMFIPYLF